jgi:3D (Asp-Asp-Asp) domain-containing protein
VAALAICAALTSIALPAAGSGSPGQSASSLRARQDRLEESSRSALLELYAIETKLAGARARVASLDRQAAGLARERRELQTGLRAARRTIAVTQRVLAKRARMLYEQGGEIDTIAILLGAESLDDAFHRLDGMEQIVAHENAILRQSRKAQNNLTALKTSLERRVAELERLRAEASASARSLEASLSEKAATIRRLRSERELNRQQLADVSAQATAAADKSEPINEQAPAASNSDTGSPEPSPGPVTKGGTMTVSSTCYCLRGTTASGLPVGPGIAATDPTVIPMGTRFYVPGYGNAVAADTGSAVKGADIDLWVADCAQASAWGRKTVTITFL